MSKRQKRDNARVGSISRERSRLGSISPISKREKKGRKTPDRRGRGKTTSGPTRDKLGDVRVKNANTLSRARAEAGIETPGILTPGQLQAVRKLRAAGYSEMEIHEITGVSQSTVHKYVKDVNPRPDLAGTTPTNLAEFPPYSVTSPTPEGNGGQASPVVGLGNGGHLTQAQNPSPHPLEPNPEEIGIAKSSAPTETTQTTRIFVGTLQVTSSRPGVIYFHLPPNVESAVVNLTASGVSTFTVQLLTHEQMERFVPSEPPQPPMKPGETIRIWLSQGPPHPRLWESSYVRSIVEDVTLKYSADWFYLVFQNPPESTSKNENSIEVDAKLTSTRTDPISMN